MSLGSALEAQPGLSQCHRRKGIQMKPSALLTTTVITVASNVYAAGILENYDSFYAKHPHVLFGDAMKFDSNSSYATPGERLAKLKCGWMGQAIRNTSPC